MSPTFKGGRTLLNNALACGLASYLDRRDLNSTIAADPTLYWRDPHPGRIIQACNRGDMRRLRFLMDSPGAPIEWPARKYRRFGNTYHASNLFEAAVNTYNQEAALLAVELQSWTAEQAAQVICDHLSHISWTAVADALLAKAGAEAVMTLLQDPSTAVCCFHGTDTMIRWYVAHGVDINVRSELDGMTTLYNAVRFTDKAKVGLLLSLGAEVDAVTLNECFCQYHWHREEDPEGSGDQDALDILRLLIPHTSPATLNALYRRQYAPIHRLVSDVWGRADILALMLAHGADINLRDRDGRTALWWAEHPDDGYVCQAYVTAIRRAGGTK